MWLRKQSMHGAVERRHKFPTAKLKTARAHHHATRHAVASKRLTHVELVLGAYPLELAIRCDDPLLAQALSRQNSQGKGHACSPAGELQSSSPKSLTLKPESVSPAALSLMYCHTSFEAWV